MRIGLWWDDVWDLPARSAVGLFVLRCTALRTVGQRFKKECFLGQREIQDACRCKQKRLVYKSILLMKHYETRPFSFSLNFDWGKIVPLHFLLEDSPYQLVIAGFLNHQQYETRLRDSWQVDGSLNLHAAAQELALPLEDSTYDGKLEEKHTTWCCDIGKVKVPNIEWLCFSEFCHSVSLEPAYKISTGCWSWMISWWLAVKLCGKHHSQKSLSAKGAI